MKLLLNGIRLAGSDSVIGMVFKRLIPPVITCPSAVITRFIRAIHGGVHQVDSVLSIENPTRINLAKIMPR